MGKKKGSKTAKGNSKKQNHGNPVAAAVARASRSRTRASREHETLSDGSPQTASVPDHRDQSHTGLPQETGRNITTAPPEPAPPTEQRAPTLPQEHSDGSQVLPIPTYAAVAGSIGATATEHATRVYYRGNRGRAHFVVSDRGARQGRISRANPGPPVTPGPVHRQRDLDLEHRDHLPMDQDFLNTTQPPQPQLPVHQPEPVFFATREFHRRSDSPRSFRGRQVRGRGHLGQFQGHTRRSRGQHISGGRVGGVRRGSFVRGHQLHLTRETYRSSPETQRFCSNERERQSVVHVPLACDADGGTSFNWGQFSQDERTLEVCVWYPPGGQQKLRGVKLIDNRQV